MCQRQRTNQRERKITGLERNGSERRNGSDTGQGKRERRGGAGGDPRVQVAEGHQREGRRPGGKGKGAGLVCADEPEMAVGTRGRHEKGFCFASTKRREMGMEGEEEDSRQRC